MKIIICNIIDTHWPARDRFFVRFLEALAELLAGNACWKRWLETLAELLAGKTDNTLNSWRTLRNKQLN